MDHVITCPFCSEKYTITVVQESAYIGQRVPCSKCGKVFIVVKAGDTLKAVEPAPEGVGYAPPIQQSNGLALAGLICGCVGFLTCGLAGIAGIICSALGLKKANQTDVGKGLAMAGLVVSILSSVLTLGLMVSILLPSLSRAREQANRVKCASNLRQIGMAATLYAQDYLSAGGPFGPDFDALVSTQSIAKNVFECPSDGGKGTGGLTGSPCSYVWVGANLTTTRSNPTSVLAYEPLSNHGGDGMNVLFADGHVEFINKNTAVNMIRKLQVGQNSPLGNVEK